MNFPYQIREWLQLAFTDHVDLINEGYYFDRNANQFYSVFITDYFLTDPNSTEEFPNSPYTKEELLILSDRINRQCGNDPSIIEVPRLTVDERKEMMQNFLNLQCPNVMEFQNQVDIENGRSNLNFCNLLPMEIAEDWEKFKISYVQSKIETFCNLQNINLESVTLWTDKKMTAIYFDLNEEEKDVATSQKMFNTKPWWKFW